MKSTNYSHGLLIEGYNSSLSVLQGQSAPHLIQCVHPTWHPISFVHYFWQEPYMGNRVSFGTQPVLICKVFFWTKGEFITAVLLVQFHWIRLWLYAYEVSSYLILPPLLCTDGLQTWVQIVLVFFYILWSVWFCLAWRARWSGRVCTFWSIPLFPFQSEQAQSSA